MADPGQQGVPARPGGRVERLAEPGAGGQGWALAAGPGCPALEKEAAPALPRHEFPDACGEGCETAPRAPSSCLPVRAGQGEPGTAGGPPHPHCRSLSPSSPPPPMQGHTPLCVSVAGELGTRTGTGGAGPLRGRAEPRAAGLARGSRPLYSLKGEASVLCMSTRPLGDRASSPS